MTATDTHRTIDAVWRIESPRLIAGLMRVVRDVGLAEDLAQDALVAALQQWPESGIPDNPGAWLMAAAKHRAIDAFRRRSTRDEKYAALAHNLSEGGALTGATEPGPAPDDVLWDPEQIDDDTLALILTSCHPVLSREAAVALTLRVIGGLTSD